MTPLPAVNGALRNLHAETTSPVVLRAAACCEKVPAARGVASTLLVGAVRWRWEASVHLSRVGSSILTPVARSLC